ncbi:hypothetical protein TNCV_4389201 [Trichonephila clavipes]|nr:hypothetical protein TNCV_4389201 [Trichonephila clavipes]
MYEGWIVRFGVPGTVVTADCETNFECDLFHSLTKYLYVHKTRTTIYNLKANGMVERFHRKVKKIWRCHHSPMSDTRHKPYCSQNN